MVAFSLYFSLLLIHATATALATSPTHVKKTVQCLQTAHPESSPEEALHDLAFECETLGVSQFDVYGDFHRGKPLSLSQIFYVHSRTKQMCGFDTKTDAQESFLRRFEKGVARDLGKEDAVFMPSGVMAQGIALLIHARNGGKHRPMFACHHTSHLLLHEDEAYRELLNLEPLVISTEDSVGPNGYSVPPMTSADVQIAFDACRDGGDVSVGDLVSALILELPHRELGGKCTPWKEVIRIRDKCYKEGVKLHCDGARLFEATTGYGMSPSQLVKPFDSVYISFYKGLGGISGAMLLGDQEFCTEARKWLRRFGGNLYSLLPYAVSGWAGYERYWKCRDGQLTFAQKKEKLLGLIRKLNNDEGVSNLVRFDPETPETNMIHGYLAFPPERMTEAINRVQETTGIRVLKRLGAVDESSAAHQEGHRSKFELSIGESNGKIEDDTFLLAWKELAKALEIQA